METLRKDIREKFEELFENILYYVLVYNFEGMIIDVNQLMLNSFGYKTEDVLNKPFKEFIKKENLPQAINAIKDLRKKGRISKPSVYQIKHANGSFKFVEIYGIPFKKNGKIQAVIALGHDITDKKIAEQRLKESELRFRTAIESLPFDFFALDKNEEYVMQNSICKKNWGDIIGKKPEDIVSDEKILQIWKNNNERALSGNLIEGEVSFVMKNEERFFYNIISPIKNENDIQGILGVNIDITEKKRAEQKIKESEKKYRDLFDSSPYSIVLIDLDGIIVDVNETSRTILGYERDEVIGTNFLELPLYEPHAIPMLKERLKMYASGKKMRPITLSLKKKDGNAFWVNPNVSLIEIDGKKHIQIIYEDVTARIETEKKLRKSEKKYRTAYNRENFYKDVFAHDTRNILQGMLSSLELCKISIKKKKDTKIVEELLDECKRQVLRGSNLVKNVKKFSELEKSERHLMKIDLEKYLNEAIKITQAYSNEKKIDISVESESNHQVKADELLIDVFENILLNAIHHNQNNHVEIMIRVSNIEENEKKMLQIEFIDNGPGIPDFKKELIFKRSNKKINSVSGTGLGLYLVYSIIQQYDAKIRVEDKIPDDHTKGSKFILTFPYC